jgi:hypothetical protein
MRRWDVLNKKKKEMKRGGQGDEKVAEREKQ